MERHAVPAGQIYRAPDMLADPHFKARNAIVSVPHPDFGELRMQNVAPRLSESPASIRTPSPAVGEHNEDVFLGLLGMPRARFDRLKEQKVI
jgi:formyl-CoA transferase